MDIDLILKGIDKDRLPEHIAIIMDGNGRWAKKRFLPRIAGHRAGVKTVDRIVTVCREIGIKALTLYSFSTENWRRPPDEISGLMNILEEYLKKELSRMLKEGIKFNTIGDITALPEFVRNIIKDTTDRTKDNNGMILTLALNYGSRQEILNATRLIGECIKEGSLEPSDINESLFESYLYTNNLPVPDLFIRTSGEIRISNFLLWQIAYSECHFTDVLWPNFKEKDLIGAIKDFQLRDRRFGKTQEQIDNEK